MGDGIKSRTNDPFDGLATHIARKGNASTPSVIKQVPGADYAKP